MPFICLCLAVWLCLKTGSENLMMVKLLQIGAMDLTVRSATTATSLSNGSGSHQLVCSLAYSWPVVYIWVVVESTVVV